MNQGPSSTWIHQWARLVIEYRRTVIALSLCLMLLALYPMKNLYFDSSNELFFLQDDPTLLTYDRLQQRFGDHEYLTIGIPARPQDETVLTLETLQIIERLTEFLSSHETVTKVTSLTNYELIRSHNNTLETAPLIGELASLNDTSATISRLSGILKAETLIHGSLITSDLKHTAIIARTLYQKGENDHKIKLIQDLQSFLKQENFEAQGFKLHLFGQALIAERYLMVSIQDQSILIPLLVLIILILLYVSFRTKHGLLMPWIVIVPTLILVTGFQGWMQWPFNVINTMLPVLIIILGIGDSVHLIVAFYHHRHEDHSPKQAAILATEQLWRPCFYTSFTTSIGFLALSVTRLIPIREFGVLGALAASLAFLMSVTLLPAILSYLHIIPKGTKQVMEQGRVTQLTHQIADFSYTHRLSLATLGFLLLTGSLVLCTQLSVDANFVNHFKESTSMRQAFEYFDLNYGGGLNIELMLNSGSPGGIKNPDFLRTALRLQQDLEHFPVTGKAFSLLDYLRKMNQALHNDDPASFQLPTSREQVAQYLLLYELAGPENDLRDTYDSREQFLRLSFRIQNMTARQINDWLDTIRNHIKSHYPDLSVELSGTLLLFNAQEIYMQDGMVQSFSIALLVIGFCFFIVFRSLKYGLLALIPSIFPIVFTGGLVALAGIALDLGTVLIAAVTIGIAVDDSIHVLNGYLQARRQGHTPRDSIHVAMTESGRAVVFTSGILICGFSVMMLASFVPFVYTGLFSGIIMGMALFADLTILPACLYLTDRSQVPQKT